MLREIQQLLKERGPMRTRDIAIHMDTSSEAIEGMLQTLERKGHVKMIAKEEPCSDGCANCSQCSKDEVQIWKLI